MKMKKNWNKILCKWYKKIDGTCQSVREENKSSFFVQSFSNTATHENPKSFLYLLIFVFYFYVHDEIHSFLLKIKEG